MSLSEIPLSKQDFDRISWQSALAVVGKQECGSYSRHFFAQSSEAEQAGDKQAAAAFGLLGAITSMVLQLDKTKNPYAPAIILQTGRSAIVEDLNENHWKVLLEITPGVTDPEMQARMADLLWVGKQNHEMARLAIDAYLQSAARLHDPASWAAPVQRIERALQLTKIIHDQARYSRVIAFIKEILDRLNGEDPLYYSHKLMELLLEQKEGDPHHNAKLAEKAAEAAEQAHDWRRANAYWTMKAKWRARAGDVEAQRIALLQAAETHVKLSDSAINQPQPDYFGGWIHLQTAIEALRRISGTQQRIEELHRQLLTYQQQAPTNMRRLGVELDMTDWALQAQEAVKGKPLDEALVTLASLVKPPQVDHLRQQVKTLARDFPFSHLISTYVMTADIRVSGQRPSSLSADPDQVEAFTRAEMFKQAQLYQAAIAMGTVEPARRQIDGEHNPRISDLLGLVSNNPFVPPGREIIYARGLHAGLEGDFLVAAHLLIPQLEQSLRYFLREAGGIVSTLDHQGIQDVMDLGDIFYTYREKLESLLGLDIVFDLQGLLVERFGTNLRNRLAHGTLEYSDLTSLSIVYLWGLTLRVCLIALVNAHRHQAAPTTPSAIVSDDVSPEDQSSMAAQSTDAESDREVRDE